MSPLYKFLSLIIICAILITGSIWWENVNSRIDGKFITFGNTTFHTSLETGIQEAANLSKPIFIYFRSQTCFWCTKFEEQALSDNKITDILNKEFVLISIDTIKQKNIAQNLNVRNTPYMIFFNNNGQEFSRIPGYLPKDEFLIKLNEILERQQSLER